MHPRTRHASIFQRSLRNGLLLRASLQYDLQNASHVYDRGLLNYDRHLTNDISDLREPDGLWLRPARRQNQILRECLFVEMRQTHRTSSSAPDPLAAADRPPGRVSRSPCRHGKLHGGSGFSIDEFKRRPASPETAHLSPTCTRACSRRMLSCPLRVRDVFVTLGIDLVSPPLDQLVVFKMFQSIRQSGIGHSG